MEGIFEALSAGHNYIISNPKTAPTISFLYGNYMMGDVAKYESDCKLEISISDIKGKAVMILYNQMGIMCETEINDDIKEYNYKHEVSSSDLFYRIEIMDGDKVQMLLVTNPIYFR